MNLIKDFFNDITKENITNGFVAFLFAVTGPVAIMLLVGTKTSLSNQELSSWLFGAFAINSVISIFFSFWFRQPLVFMWSIPGIILIGSSIENYSFNEIVGTYLVTGMFLTFLGLTNILNWINKKIPIEIVMGMVAAIFLQFSLKLALLTKRNSFTIWINDNYLLYHLCFSFATKNNASTFRIFNCRCFNYFKL